jgi:subtilisin family serine protease
MDQIDPALLEEIARGPADEEVDVILRLRRPGVVPEGVRVIAEFGDVVTARVRRGDITRVHDLDDVESVKAPGSIRPSLPDAPEGDTDATPRPSDRRRPTSDPAAGRGVVVAVLDWWFDLAHPAFRRTDGSSRVVAFWDQREVPGPGRRPSPYGYGRVLSRADITRCLGQPDPYTCLNYRPWDGADAARGTHGTHVAGIAAGGPHAGVSGVASHADLVLVHLADRKPRQPGVGLGNSVSLLEGVDFVARTARDRPWALNISAGRHAGHHRGVTLVERALDNAVTARRGCFVAQSGGNYYRQRAHAAVELVPGAERHLVWVVDTNDPTPNELEGWYPGSDVLRFTLRAPTGDTVTVPLSEAGELRHDGQLLCRIYHRRREPNTGLNHVQVFMQPLAPGGDWQVTLHGDDVTDGRTHLWVERDDPRHQSRFADPDAVATTTIGSICNGFYTIATGAYDPHSPGRPVGAFSSCGPTADGRRRPNLLAPGVDILAPRSAPAAGGPHGLVRKSGTSMAAPHITGSVACLLEISGRLSIADIRRLLITSLDPPPDPVDNAYRVGQGCLNVDRLLAAGRAWAASRSHQEAGDLTVAGLTVAGRRSDHGTAEAAAGDVLDVGGSMSGANRADDLAVWAVVDPDARIRLGPPTFALDGDRRIPPFTRVRIGARQDRYRRVVGLDGTDHGWTAASNLQLFLRDQPDLTAASLGAAVPIVLPGGATPRQRVLAATHNRIGGLAGALSARLAIRLPAVLAVWYVESSGRPHYVGRTLLRFENHLLWRQWGQQYADVFDAHFQFGSRPPRQGADCPHPWTCHHFRPDPSQPFRSVHTGQPAEYAALAVAAQLAGEETALRCASLGGPQILSRHHARLGYATSREMFDAFNAAERAEILGFFDFCRSVAGLLDALRDRNWQEVARLYNGPGQVPVYAAHLAGAEQDAVRLLGMEAPVPEAPVPEVPVPEVPAAEAAVPLALGRTRRQIGLVEGPGGTPRAVASRTPLYLPYRANRVWPGVTTPESTRSQAARLEWTNLTLTPRGDGTEHLYYLMSGPPGGGPSRFMLRVTNTNSANPLKNTVLKVRLRAKRPTGQVEVIPLADQGSSPWKLIRSQEISAGSSRTIELYLDERTRSSTEHRAYDPESPLRWLDVEFHWAEGGPRLYDHHYASTSLAFYLLAPVEFLLSRRRKVDDKALDDPAEYFVYWHLLAENSDPSPVDYKLSVQASVSNTETGQVTVTSGTTLTRGREQAREVTDTSEISAGFGIEKMFSLGQKLGTSVTSSIRWNDTVAREFTEVASRTRSFTQGHAQQFEISGRIPPAPRGRRQALYRYPVFGVYEVPVILFSKPNEFGQATRRTADKVPVVWLSGWGTKTVLR